MPEWESICTNLASETLNGNVFTSACTIESVDLEYDRLGYVNFVSIKQLKHMKLISTVNVDNLTKCFVCIDTKYALKTL